MPRHSQRRLRASRRILTHVACGAAATMAAKGKRKWTEEMSRYVALRRHCSFSKMQQSIRRFPRTFGNLREHGEAPVRRKRPQNAGSLRTEGNSQDRLPRVPRRCPRRPTGPSCPSLDPPQEPRGQVRPKWTCLPQSQARWGHGNLIPSLWTSREKDEP